MSKTLFITGIILSLSSAVLLYVFNNQAWEAPLNLQPLKLNTYQTVSELQNATQETQTHSKAIQSSYVWKFEQLQSSYDTLISFQDSTSHRILLLGDSEVGGFKYPLSRYCTANGHQLVGVVEWNSSTIFNFAYSDTIDVLISKFKPTYVFILIGLNEVYAKDLTLRLKAAYLFKKKFEHLPFAWIGPASWIPDFGISDVFLNVAGADNFYPSKHLNLPRASDNRHPSVLGYDIWMDSVGVWMKKDPIGRFNLILLPKKYLQADFIQCF